MKNRSEKRRIAVTVLAVILLIQTVACSTAPRQHSNYGANEHIAAGTLNETTTAQALTNENASVTASQSRGADGNPPSDQARSPTTENTNDPVLPKIAKGVGIAALVLIALPVAVLAGGKGRMDFRF